MSVGEGGTIPLLGPVAYALLSGRNHRLIGVTCQEEYIHVEVLIWSIIETAMATRTLP
jgi:hypothetical protein